MCGAQGDEDNGPNCRDVEQRTQAFPLSSCSSALYLEDMGDCCAVMGSFRPIDICSVVGPLGCGVVVHSHITCPGTC